MGGELRRQKLIWFALGAACTALAALLARLLVPTPDEKHAYLAVYDHSYSPEEFPNLNEVGPLSARLFRGCGAENFSVSLAGVDKGAFSLIQINPDSEGAVRCIVKRAPAEGHSLQIRVLTDRQARLILGW